MGPSGRITHMIGLYCTVWDRICRYCIWVEFPVQRRLCPIFMKNVGSPDNHEYSVGGRVVNGPPGFRASHACSRTETGIRGFLGRLQYISHSIAKLIDICEPIFRLLRKNQPTVWNDGFPACF